jgi:hypothetical protein
MFDPLGMVSNCSGFFAYVAYETAKQRNRNDVRSNVIFYNLFLDARFWPMRTTVRQKWRLGKSIPLRYNEVRTFELA